MTEVAVDNQSYKVYQGKHFTEAWEFATSPTGPADDLSDYVSAEIRLEPINGGGPATVWSVASGHVTIADDKIAVNVPYTETDDMSVGDYTMFLSRGHGPVPDELVLQGFVVVVDAM